MFRRYTCILLICGFVPLTQPAIRADDLPRGEAKAAGFAPEKLRTSKLC